MCLNVYKCIGSIRVDDANDICKNIYINNIYRVVGN